jgi:hypothetical protein
MADEEVGWNWYFSADYEAEGWMACPALINTSTPPPKRTYVRTKAR